MADNIFTRHPGEVGETYGEHFRSAGGFGLRMLAGGLACLVHAVFPFWFIHTGSRTMDALHRRMTRRRLAADLERHPII
ncbi:MAG: DUF6356 family protein [Pseudomonadota bacterium]|nr:DUF6356 family protein [Pseudomonadota bacterium]